MHRPSKTLDRRVNAVRGDLADIALAGKIFVPHYAEPITKFALMVTGIHAKPSSDSTMVSQLNSGEKFAILDRTGGWAWGYCIHDHYVGYVRLADLCEYQAVGDIEINSDYVVNAEAFVGAPYLWGGRSAGGIDCSGLIQIALGQAGISAPRDADQQMIALGRNLSDDETLQRGDLIFFPQHVGMMIDNANMVHSTMFYGKVVREKLSDVVQRILLKHPVAILARKRLP